VYIGFIGPPPEVIFGDEVNLAHARTERDKILIDSGMVAKFSEEYLLDNYGFRPGEIELPTELRPEPNTEVIEVKKEDTENTENIEDTEDIEDTENSGNKRATPPKKIKAALAAGIKKRPSLPSDFLIEGLAAWGALKAGKPIIAKELRNVMINAPSAAVLVDRLIEVQNRFNMNFTETLLDTDETAIIRGIKDLKEVK
jgi:hypothetical protein